MSAPSFSHSEADVVLILGVARKGVRNVRADELTNGVDWKHERGVVRYSDKGRERLFSLVKSSPVYSAPSAPAAPVPAAVVADEPAGDVILKPVASDPLSAPKPGEEHELVITKKFINRAIVQALIGASSVRVRVEDTQTLTVGKFIRCRLIDGDLSRMTQRLRRAG